MDTLQFSQVVSAFKDNLSSQYFNIVVEGNCLYISPVHYSDDCAYIVYGTDLNAVMTIYSSLLVLFPSQLSIFFDIKNYRFVVYLS